MRVHYVVVKISFEVCFYMSELIIPNKARREQLAELVLNSVIELNMPSDDLLIELYDRRQLSANKKIIETYFENVLSKVGSVSDLDIIKTINVYEKTEISVKKNDILNKEFMNPIRDHLKDWVVPPDESLRVLFGDYTSFAKTIIDLFNHGKTRIRTCNLPFNMHNIRCAATSEALQYDIHNSGKYHNFLWLVHDSIEDLLRSVKDKKGNNYQINGLDKFLGDYFPSEHHEDLILLSNFSDMILKYLKQNRHVKIENVKSLNKNLHKLERTATNSIIKYNLQEMIEVIPKDEYFSHNNFFEEVKLFLYDKVFLKNLVNRALDRNELVLVEGKGVCDMQDNCDSRIARELPDIKNAILKIENWYDRVINGLDNYEASIYSNLTRDRAEQLLLHANYSAKVLGVEYLSKPMVSPDYFLSGFDSISELSSVFYRNPCFKNNFRNRV